MNAKDRKLWGNDAVLPLYRVVISMVGGRFFQIDTEKQPVIRTKSVGHDFLVVTHGDYECWFNTDQVAEITYNKTFAQLVDDLHHPHSIPKDDIVLLLRGAWERGDVDPTYDADDLCVIMAELIERKAR